MDAVDPGEVRQSFDKKIKHHIVWALNVNLGVVAKHAEKSR